jgi:hypothetical protein
VVSYFILRVKSYLVIGCLIRVLHLHYQSRNQIVSKQVILVFFGENSRIALDH